MLLFVPPHLQGLRTSILDTSQKIDEYLQDQMTLEKILYMGSISLALFVVLKNLDVALGVLLKMSPSRVHDH